MQKISFDAEDFPPPSYYYRRKSVGDDDNDNVDEEDEAAEELLGNNRKMAEKQQQIGIDLHHEPKNVMMPKCGQNSVNNNAMAPVHRSGNKNSSSLSPTSKLNNLNDKVGTLDKSEWWKAPEFVPRATGRVVQLSTPLNGGGYVTQSTMSSSTPNGCQQPVVLGGADSSLSLSQMAMMAPHHHQQMHPRLAPFPMQIPAGMGAAGPNGGPAFMPLPLPPPPPPFGSPASIAALHAQLARVHAHNPRLIRGVGQHMALPNHPKLQHFLMRQHQQQQQQQQQQFFQRQVAAAWHSIGGPGSAVPNGYTANVTTIDGGLGGPPIPAIVLKRKRKKKNRKPAVQVNASGGNQQSQQQTALSPATNQPEKNQELESLKPDIIERRQINDRDQQIKSKRDALSLESESREHGDEDEDDDETTTSSFTSSMPLADIRRSEPDLTKMQHHYQTDTADCASKPCDVVANAADLERLSNFPNDLDLIQSAASSHCVMITGSCPDLSSDDTMMMMMTMDPNARSGPSLMTKSMHTNPFLRIDTYNDEADDDYDDNGRNNNEKQKLLANDRSAYDGNGFEELDTNPIVRNAMRDLASDGMVRSEQVKQLNRQVLKDMRLEEKVRNWHREDWSEPELEEDDTVFERLLKTERAKYKHKKNDDDKPKHQQQKQHQQQQYQQQPLQTVEPNPGRGQKSLREELEEGLLIFGNRGARDYDRLPTNDQDDEAEDENRRLVDGPKQPMTASTAIVHSSRRSGQPAKSELFRDGENHVISNRKGGYIPRTTFIDDDEDMDSHGHMRITVNALDVEGSDALLAKSHMQSAAAAANDQRPISANTHNAKRRLSLPDEVPLVPLQQTRHCCVLM